MLHHNTDQADYLGIRDGYSLTIHGKTETCKLRECWTVWFPKMWTTPNTDATWLRWHQRSSFTHSLWSLNGTCKENVELSGPYVTPKMWTTPNTDASWLPWHLRLSFIYNPWSPNGTCKENVDLSGLYIMPNKLILQYLKTRRCKYYTLCNHYL